MILEEINQARPVTLNVFLIRSPQLFADVGLGFHTMRFDWTMQRMPDVTTQEQDDYNWEVARKRHKAKHYCTGPYQVPKKWEEFVEQWMYDWRYVVQAGPLFFNHLGWHNPTEFYDLYVQTMSPRILGYEDDADELD